MAMKTGPKPKYNKRMAARILKRLAAGESLRAICKRLQSCPGESTVRRWAINNIDGFGDRYAMARDLGLDSMAEETLEISDDAERDWEIERNDKGEVTGIKVNGEHISRSKLKVETRKWYLSQLAPNRYGNNVAVRHSGGDGPPIQIEDGRSNIQRAREVLAMIAEAQAAPTLLEEVKLIENDDDA